MDCRGFKSTVFGDYISEHTEFFNISRPVEFLVEGLRFEGIKNKSEFFNLKFLKQMHKPAFKSRIIFVTKKNSHVPFTQDELH